LSKKKLSFDVDAAKIVEEIAQRGSGGKLIYKNKEYMMIPIPDKEMVLAHVLYHLVFYTYGVSGDVFFYQFEPPLFRRDDKYFEYLFRVVPRSSTSILERGVEGCRIAYHFVDNAGYQRIYAILWGERSKIMQHMFTGAEPYEEEVVKKVLAAGRIAKMAARTLIPIVNMKGEVVDVEPLQKEDEIFITVLNYFLRRSEIENATR